MAPCGHYPGRCRGSLEVRVTSVPGWPVPGNLDHRRRIRHAKLARLSLWVPPGRLGEFETNHWPKLLRILKQHDLVEAAESGRNAVPGIFSRLFELPSPAHISTRQRALHKSPVWREALRNLGAIFGTTFAATRRPGMELFHNGYFTAGMIAEMAPLLRYEFGLYATPAGSGRTATAGPGTRQGAWWSLSVKDGLADSVVAGVLEARDGCIWFATRGSGVSRFDGVEFTTYSEEDGLAGNDVCNLIEDREGNLWFASSGGACRFDGEEFSAFTAADGLAHNYVSNLLQDRDGGLWIGTFGGGISRYDGRAFATYTSEDGLAGDNIRSILQDCQGNLWIGTKNGGVTRFDGEAFSTFNYKDGLGTGSVNCILEDRKGRLWFATGAFDSESSCTVARYDGHGFVSLGRDDGLAENHGTWITEDRVGRLWVATGTQGVCRIKDTALETFNSGDGLIHDQVTCIVEDRAGRVWFGIWGGGVSRYAEQDLYNFGLRDGLEPGGIGDNLVADDSGTVWFGSKAGVSGFDGEAVYPLDALGDEVAWPLLQDAKGDLWFGARQGLRRYDGGQSTATALKMVCLVIGSGPRLRIGTGIYGLRPVEACLATTDWSSPPRSR